MNLRPSPLIDKSKLQKIAETLVPFVECAQARKAKQSVA